MEVFEIFVIKLSNAVLIDIMEKPIDELIDFLEQYGDIKQKVTLDSPESEFDQMLVVEFSSGLPLAQLFPLLPYVFTSEEGDKFRIESLSQIYASMIGGLKTNSYLADLKEIAKMSGKNYAEILKDVMSQIHQSIVELCPDVQVEAKMEQTADSKESGVQQSQPHNTTFLQASSSAPLPTSPSSRNADLQNQEKHSTSISAGDLNPPEVQRYVVEHVRSGDSSMHTSHRLRAFSGKIPRPSHETDYDTWRSNVELVLQDLCHIYVTVAVYQTNS